LIYRLFATHFGSNKFFMCLRVNDDAVIQNAEDVEDFAEERGDEAFLSELCGNLRDLCG